MVNKMKHTKTKNRDENEKKKRAKMKLIQQNSKIYKDYNTSSCSNFRIVMIFPGDLVVAGCLYSFFDNLIGGFH